MKQLSSPLLNAFHSLLKPSEEATSILRAWKSIQAGFVATQGTREPGMVLLAPGRQERGSAHQVLKETWWLPLEDVEEKP